MDIHPVDILISMLNIIVLFLLLRVLLWKYIVKYLSERTERIRRDIDNAAAASKRAELLEVDYKSKIKMIEQREQEMIAESRAKAEEEAEEIRNEARHTAEEIIKDARYRMELEHKQILKDAQAEIIHLATDMASNILRREVSDADNYRVVDDFFKFESSVK